MKPDLVMSRGRCAAREGQHIERLPVIGLRPHAAVQPRDRLHIVVEYVRPGVQHARDGIRVAAEIRSQHFNASLRQRAPHQRAGFRRNGANRHRQGRRDSRW